MKLIKLFNKFKCNQEGAVIVIVAVFMTALIGISALVLDLGLAFNKKAELQKDLDSIALAAVSELPATSESDPKWGKAVEVALKYAELNGVNNLNIGEPKLNTEGTKIVGMAVSSNVNVSYNFAKILGFSSGNVATSSTAEIRTVDGGVTGLMPFAIDEESMKKIKCGTLKKITIKDDSFSDIFGNGWFGAVDIDKVGSDSGAVYVDKIKNGSTVELKIGETLNMVSGNMPTPTAKALNERLADHFYCVYNAATGKVNHEGYCPRIVSVPIVQIILNDKQDKIDHLKVIGFASVFIELDEVSFEGGKIKFTGNDGELEVTFIKETMVPTATVGDIPEEHDFGFYSPRLVN